MNWLHDKLNLSDLILIDFNSENQNFKSNLMKSCSQDHVCLAKKLQVTLRTESPVHVGQLGHVLVQGNGGRQLKRVDGPLFVVNRRFGNVAVGTLCAGKHRIVSYRKRRIANIINRYFTKYTVKRTLIKIKVKIFTTCSQVYWVYSYSNVQIFYKIHNFIKKLTGSWLTRHILIIFELEKCFFLVIECWKIWIINCKIFTSN